MNTFRDNIQEIKARITVLTYARDVLGWSVRKSGDRVCSLEGGHNKTALVVHDSFFYDFKASKGGDVIDLCALTRHNGDKGAAIRELATRTGVELGGYASRCDQWQDFITQLETQVTSWAKALRPEDNIYLRSRHIPQEYAEKMMIGFDGSRLVIPYFKNGHVVYYNTRRTEYDKCEHSEGEPKYKKAKINGLNENIPWGLHTLTRSTPLIIAEGCFDAMSFDVEGFRVLSGFGGDFSRDATPQVLAACRDVARDAGQVCICFDRDEAGQKFTRKWCERLFKARISFSVIDNTTFGVVCDLLRDKLAQTDPEDAAKQSKQLKDISDFYSAGGDLDTLVNSARSGLRYLADVYYKREAFKRFAREAGRFVGKPELAEFFAIIEDLGRYPQPWLKAVKQLATSCPTETTIAKEVTESHKLRYSDALGFYEYHSEGQGGLWSRKSDAEIMHYIGNALGQYSTGSRVTNVMKLLRGYCVYTGQYDRAAVFNFKNGTLELDSGIFREAREGDNCTTQAAYNYDASAQCPQWLDFIRSVTLGDEQKAALLQELSGYVLFNDCALQKCAFFIGDGANGKSVFLDVISEVFGADNVSNVEMSALVEAFQRIALYSSILNISAETQTNVKGAEAIFKQLVVGDKVSACYKGKDFITFRSRAKLFCSANEFVKTSDLTYGFTRRILFVRFAAHFSDNPKPGEYQADKSITTKLLAELPGVFNWCFVGYKRLKQTQRFTETAEQVELLEDFKRATDPVINFAEDRYTSDFSGGRYTRDGLYSIYKDWCESNGHKAASNTSFTRRLKKILPQLGFEIKEGRSGNERYFDIVRKDNTTPSVDKRKSTAPSSVGVPRKSIAASVADTTTSRHSDQGSGVAEVQQDKPEKSVKKARCDTLRADIVKHLDNTPLGSVHDAHGIAAALGVSFLLVYPELQALCTQGKIKRDALGYYCSVASYEELGESDI